MRFKFTGIVPDELAGGRPLAFGDVVSLARSEQRANARLIDQGLLLPLPAQAGRKTKTTQESDK